MVDAQIVRSIKFTFCASSHTSSTIVQFFSVSGVRQMATTYSGPHSMWKKWRRTIIKLRHRPFLQQTWNRRTSGAHLEKLLANSFAKHSFWSRIQIDTHVLRFTLRMKRWLMTDLLSTDNKWTDERNICFVRTSSVFLGFQFDVLIIQFILWNIPFLSRSSGNYAPHRSSLKQKWNDVNFVTNNQIVNEDDAHGECSKRNANKRNSPRNYLFERERFM